MPKLIIDNLEIEVPDGTKVIDAAEWLGIMIPRFCYHEALGSVGACRVCAVKFVEGPIKGVEMSCMVDAKDGMVVSTTDEEAVTFRKYVIEWLMLNHPHDCPVCDEGGHCLLQDETVSGGHGLRRYLGTKRTYQDQYLGPFIQHEMNRCIHCFRCRRFYQEFTGYRDLGALQIGNRSYFGRFCDGPLESPFSGNLIDICPTGVYTDKPARYKGRRWDFERGPSLCLHCSLGCNTISSARYREIVRQEARLNEAVNGYFICDRGRFGHDYANHVERPRRPRIGKREVSWDAALQAASNGLTRILETAGPKAIACLGSTRNSVETQGHLKRLCRILGWPDPRYFIEPSMEVKVRRAVSRLDARLAVSMKEIQEADFILGVGADPMNEAPMLALAMRQAFRSSARIAVVDPRPVFLPFQFDHLAVSARDLNPCLDVIVKEALGRSDQARLGPAASEFFHALPGEYPSDSLLQDRLLNLGQKLRQSERPVIICGTDIVRGKGRGQGFAACGKRSLLPLSGPKETPSGTGWTGTAPRAGLFALPVGRAGPFPVADPDNFRGSEVRLYQPGRTGSVRTSGA
jgi:NADH-quinone oxidoreductase subunit G